MIRELQYAGEYSLLSLELEAPGKPPVNLETLVLEIEIVEDIDLPGIFGQCIISETANLTNILPIIGEEKLELIIQTPPLSDPRAPQPEFDKKEYFVDRQKGIDTRFDVYAVDFKVHSENFSQATYALKFCSPEVLKNNNKSVSYSVNGTAQEMVNQVMQRELSSDKTMTTVKTDTQKNIVIPNLDPFSAVAYIASVSEDGKSDPNFKFFENNDGFQYTSLTELYRQKPHWEFGMSSAGINPQSLMSQLESLTGQNMKHNDKQLDIKTGVLGSNLLVHDIYNKRYLNKPYNYVQDYATEEHIEDDGKKNLPIYSSTEDFSTSRTFYQVMSIKEENGKQFDGRFTGSYKIPNELAKNQTSRRASQMQLLNQAFEIECQAAGNTNLTAGKMVKLEIPKAVDSKAEDYGEPDRFFQGNFLMTRIKHVFHSEGKEHKVYMHMVKDGQVPVK